MNIHLTHDEKFINASLDLFERYYPGDNLFWVQVPKGFQGHLSNVREQENVQPVRLTSRQALAEYLPRINDGDNILVHFLNPVKAAFVQALKRYRNVTVYWIFYGGDLYDMLAEKGDFQLVDDPNTRKNKTSLKEKLKNRVLSGYYGVPLRTAREAFIRDLDYFCFWNPYDYELFKQHFFTRAVFKEFRYFSHQFHQVQQQPVQKQPGSLLLNHSATPSGNHLTVLNRLKAIGAEAYLKQLIVPLSYGATYNKKAVLDYGREEWPGIFQPVTELLPREEYFALINSVQVAIFGHRRQQGGGNLYHLLASGAKVFLRNSNSLLHYFRDKGYQVFSFEDDLQSTDDLAPLPEADQKTNRALALFEYSQEEVDRIYNQLLN